ncbi:MAG: hypothetical protein WDM94_11425 [Bauldia sp.]
MKPGETDTIPRRWRLLVAGGICAVGLALPALAQPVEVPLPRLAPDKGAAADTTDAPAIPLLSAAAATKGATPPADSGDDSGDAIDSGDSGDGTDDIGAGSGDDLDAVPDVAPDAQPDVGPPSDIRPGSFTLEARLAPKGPPLGDGVKWRIFGDTPGPDGHLQLLGEADGGIVYFGLNPGTYYVHAAYGRAGATRKISVNGRTGGEVVVLNAGGVRLMANNNKDQPLHQARSPLTSTPPTRRARRNASCWSPTPRPAMSSASTPASTTSSRNLARRTPSCAPTSRSTPAS